MTHEDYSPIFAVIFYAIKHTWDIYLLLYLFFSCLLVSGGPSIVWILFFTICVGILSCLFFQISATLSHVTQSSCLLQIRYSNYYGCYVVLFLFICCSLSFAFRVYIIVYLLSIFKFAAWNDDRVDDIIRSPRRIRRTGNLTQFMTCWWYNKIFSSGLGELVT